MLKKRGIVFEPLDYARTVYPAQGVLNQSVEEYLETADSQETAYDFLITDLNFTSGGLGGGEKDGFSALRLARSKCPAIKLILMTAHGRSISPQDAIRVAQETGLLAAHWIDLSGYGIQDWQNLATICELLCDLIDGERLGHPKATPDLYEIVVKEHTTEKLEDGSQKEHLSLFIREKKSGGKVSPEFQIDGDHALILQEIAFGAGSPVTGRALLNSLNRLGRGGSEFVTYGLSDVQLFLDRYEIRLIGEEPGNAGRSMCRRDNNVLCKWQRGGGDPTPDAEGYTCFVATGGASNGYCPKKQLKTRQPPVTSSLQDGADRRKVQEMRVRYLRPLDGIFGSEFSGARGLIRTFHGPGGGYALAGTIRYHDKG
jgi:hypothetical protein